MSSDKNLHLEEDQLSKAVVDESDLSPSQQEHLSNCHQCRERKEKIEASLSQLGQMAKRFSPSPKKRFSLPIRKEQRSFLRSWQWRTALGVAVTAIFIAVVVVPTLHENTQEQKELAFTQEILEAEDFMNEVTMLAENALPQEYMDITGETGEETDEGFMDFMTPTEEDSWSLAPTLNKSLAQKRCARSISGHKETLFHFQDFTV